MQKQETGFEGLLILQPKTYTDERGSFHESWNIDTFKKLNLNITFVQDNQSTSHRNVLRGLHFSTSTLYARQIGSSYQRKSARCSCRFERTIENL